MSTSLTFDVALEGGGTKGIALNAAIAEIERRGHSIRRVVGNSAGAIAAALISAGYTGDELVALSRTPTAEGLAAFSEYITEPLPQPKRGDWLLSDLEVAALNLTADLSRRVLSLRQAAAFLERGGFVSGNGFDAWLARQLERKRSGMSQFTLAELYEYSGRHLTILVTDTSARRLRVLNHFTAPQCPVAAAVRMSMSIPLLFAEVIWQKEWGPYVGEDLTGHVMVDGGVLMNLPLAFVLPGPSAFIQSLLGPLGSGEALPLGLVLDTTLEVEGAPPLPPRASFMQELLTGTRMGQRMTALAETLLRGIDLTLADLDATALCRLPAKGYRATEFDMSPARVDALLNAAARATEAYLDALGG